MIYLKKAEEKEVKKREKEQITIRLNEEFKHQLQTEADRRGESLNGLIIIMLHKAWDLINQDRF